MASGSDCSSSFTISSDKDFDRICDVCKNDDMPIVSEAICFCTVCYKHFCTQCRGFHNKFHPEHRDRLLDRAAMLTNLPKRPVPAALTVTCEEHTDKLVEMYCYDHDVVCCTVCLAIKHKKCNKADYVPKIADGALMNYDINKLKHGLQTVKKDLIGVKSSRNDGITSIKQAKERVLILVEESRQRMNAVFDQLEEAVIRDNDKLYGSFIVNTQSDLNECDAAISKIEKSMKSLDYTNKNNAAQLFVQVKTGAKTIKVLRDTVNKIQNKVDQEVTFKMNGNIQNYLDRLESLGELVDDYLEHASHRAVDVIKPRTVARMYGMMVKMKEDRNTMPFYTDAE